MARIVANILIVDDTVDIHADFAKIIGRQNSVPQSDAIDALEADLFGEPGASEQKEPPKIDLNFNLKFATQGQDAYLLVADAIKKGEHFSVCYMDMRMPPGWDGLETIQKIWQIDPNIEMVICTAYSEHSWLHIVDTLGITDKLLFLKKPFEPIEIQQTCLALASKWIVLRKLDKLMLEQQKDLHRLTAVLETERAKLVQNSRFLTMGLMTAGIAHEINNPLSILNGHLGSMERSIKTGSSSMEKMEATISKAKNCIFRISAIIDGLRNFGKETEQIQESREDLRLIVNDTVKLCQMKIEQSGIALTVKCDVSAFILCRPVQISEVIVNLISNSYDAIDKSEGPRWVAVELTRQDSYAAIFVTDSGKGIPSEIAKEIMNPFFSTKKDGDNSGIGLNLVQKIIESHRGKFRYVPDFPNTRFEVLLPIVE